MTGFNTGMKASWILLLACLLSNISNAANRNCAPNLAQTRQAKVQKIIDGDTLILTDGTVVRLLGINTPEKATKNAPAEPLADQASSALKQLIASTNYKIRVLAVQQRDRHKRLLAHVFTLDGQNIQQLLLRKGLAINLAWPPNLRFQKCYQQAEKIAHSKRHGVWGSSWSRPIELRHLNNTMLFGSAAAHDNKSFAGRNFIQLVGTVTSVAHSRNSVWLNFAGRHLTVRIARGNLRYFSDWRPSELKGRRIIIKGYVTRNRSRHPRAARYYMLLRHPDMLRFTP